MIEDGSAFQPTANQYELHSGTHKLWRFWSLRPLPPLIEDASLPGANPNKTSHVQITKARKRGTGSERKRTGENQINLLLLYLGPESEARAKTCRSEQHLSLRFLFQTMKVDSCRPFKKIVLQNAVNGRRNYFRSFNMTNKLMLTKKQ